MQWSVAAVLLSLGAAFVADQRSKAVALTMLAGRSAARSGPRRAGLRIVRTPALLLPIGRSFAGVVWIAMLAASLAIAGRAQAGWTLSIALGAALGGAAGNLCDLWRRDAVIDFVDPGWWPPFNLADVLIAGGTLTATAAWWAS